MIAWRSAAFGLAALLITANGAWAKDKHGHAANHSTSHSHGSSHQAAPHKKSGASWQKHSAGHGSSSSHRQSNHHGSTHHGTGHHGTTRHGSSSRHHGTTHGTWHKGHSSYHGVAQPQRRAPPPTPYMLPGGLQSTCADGSLPPCQR